MTRTHSAACRCIHCFRTPRIHAALLDALHDAVFPPRRRSIQHVGSRLLPSEWSAARRLVVARWPSGPAAFFSFLTPSGDFFLFLGRLSSSGPCTRRKASSAASTPTPLPTSAPRSSSTVPLPPPPYKQQLLHGGSIRRKTGICRLYSLYFLPPSLQSRHSEAL